MCSSVTEGFVGDQLDNGRAHTNGFLRYMLVDRLARARTVIRTFLYFRCRTLNLVYVHMGSANDAYLGLISCVCMIDESLCTAGRDQRIRAAASVHGRFAEFVR